MKKCFYFWPISIVDWSCQTGHRLFWIVFLYFWIGFTDLSFSNPISCHENTITYVSFFIFNCELLTFNTGHSVQKSIMDIKVLLCSTMIHHVIIIFESFSIWYGTAPRENILNQPWLKKGRIRNQTLTSELKNYARKCHYKVFIGNWYPKMYLQLFRKMHLENIWK